MKSEAINGKKILVTGGTGSFGKYITKFLLNNSVDSVTVFSRDEEKQNSMEFDLQEFKGKLSFFLGDVREKESLLKATQGKDIVFHAAALKQIPSTEYNPLEAIKTNVLGAQNVVDACIANNVDKVIAISTDKAVEPVNTMGMTKALQEKIFINGNRERYKARTKFSLVRYGNVLNSRGSVIPLFIKQINKGIAVSITDKEMTRFILTLSQAIGLVMTALTHMNGGEIFIPKIKSLKIMDLAEVIVEELKAQKELIKVTRIRPGEKLHEVLMSTMEYNRAVDEKNFYRILPQIELVHEGYSSTMLQTKKKIQMKVYASNTGPFLTKGEIRNILKLDGVI